MSENNYGGFFDSPGQIKEPIEKKAYVQERATLAEDIRKLYWLNIANLIITVLTNDTLAELLPFISGLASIAGIVCSIVTLVIFFRMGNIIDEYRTAAYCTIASVVVSIVGVIVGVIAEISFGGGAALVVIVAIISAIVSVYASYKEFQGHVTILSGIDDELAEKWNTLWNWTMFAAGTAILGLLLMFLLVTLAAVVMLIGGIVAIVAIVLRVKYMKEMADLFEELAIKCEIAIKEAAEAEEE